MPKKLSVTASLVMGVGIGLLQAIITYMSASIKGHVTVDGLLVWTIVLASILYLIHALFADEEGPKIPFREVVKSILIELVTAMIIFGAFLVHLGELHL